MKNITYLIFALALIITINASSQSSKMEFGFKAGTNFSKFTPDIKLGQIELLVYKRKIGFYAGGFIQFNINDKINFQPELLLSSQGTTYIIKDIQITDTNGETTIYNPESNFNEFVLSIPLIFRCELSKKVFLEGGPQIGYTLNSYEKFKKNTFPGNGPQNQEYFIEDKFDFGLTVGSGYNINENFILNGRFQFGLIERDNMVKSSVFTLGLEYKL